MHYISRHHYVSRRKSGIVIDVCVADTPFTAVQMLCDPSEAPGRNNTRPKLNLQSSKLP
jgi:hypothetical protein